MSFTDYRLPQILDSKKVCFKPPKHAKVKLLIKFIKNNTLRGWLTFLTIQGKFYNNNKF